LPKLETEVLVINSFLSILIEKSWRRGHRGGSLRPILRYDKIILALRELDGNLRFASTDV